MSEQSVTNEIVQKVVHTKSWRHFFMDLTIASVPLLICGSIVYKLMSHFDDNKKRKEDVRKTQEELNKRLQKAGRSIQETSQHENLVLGDIYFAHQINVSFDDIGGMKTIKDQIYETVILPLQNPELFSSVSNSGSLTTVPKGVLFYGPPGTGKTMMAKAIAKEIDATFINVQMSTLQNKWFGESQKLVRAVFSVARKFAPSIIFIDEVDVFLRDRSSSEHEASGTMKAEFMSLWDGLTTDEYARVTVLGATNRPFDIDHAILRRLPRTFLFDLPDEKERTSILQVILQGQALSPDVSLATLASQTERYSGSDLKEMCKYAAMLPVRELIRTHKDASEQGKRTSVIEGKPRPLSVQDFANALEQCAPTGQRSYDYQKHFDQWHADRTGAGKRSRTNKNIHDVINSLAKNVIIADLGSPTNAANSSTLNSPSASGAKDANKNNDKKQSPEESEDDEISVDGGDD